MIWVNKCLNDISFYKFQGFFLKYLIQYIMHVKA